MSHGAVTDVYFRVGAEMLTMNDVSATQVLPPHAVPACGCVKPCETLLPMTMPSTFTWDIHHTLVSAGLPLLY